MKKILTLSILLCIGVYLYAGDLRKSEPSKPTNPTLRIEENSPELHSARKATINGCPSSDTFYWWGEGSSYRSPAGGNKQWINAGNWSVNNHTTYSNPSGRIPSACDSVVISMGDNGDVRLSADAEANGFLFKITVSGKTATLYTNGNTLTINGDANINAVSGATIEIGTPSGAGTVEFLGNVNIGSTSGGTARFVGHSTSTMKFGANVTLGPSAEIVDPPGTAIFYKTFVGDSIMHLNYNTAKTARFNNVTVLGISILTLGGTNTPGNITGDLTLDKHGTLRLPEGTQLNRQTTGGTFTMLDSSSIYVQGLSSVSNGGLPVASLPAGSNFPGGFSTYNFQDASTVYYSGGESTPQTIYSAPSYNALTLRAGGNVAKTVTNDGTITTAKKVFLEKNVTWIMGADVHHGSKFVVRNFADLVMGNYKLTGSNGFQLDDKGTIEIGSPDGITTSGSTGNIQSSGTRSFSTDANYVYNGTSHQVMGSGLPAIQRSLTIDNASNVELTGDAEPTQGLTLTSGNLEIKNHTLSLHDVTYSSGRLAGSDESNVTVKGTNVSLRFTNSNKGNYLKNLTLTNGAKASLSKTLGDTLNITGGYSAPGQAGKVTLGNGAQLTTNGGHLTLKSNKYGTASLSEVPVNGSGVALASIVGDVIVERFINIGTESGQHGKKWHLLATPAGGQTIKESWMEGGASTNGYGIQLTSPSGTGWDNYSPSPSVKSYNYSNNTWVGATNATDNLEQDKGWMVFIRGDRTVGGQWDPAKPTTLRSEGSLTLGKKTITIPAKTGGFYAIGNPYASAVDVRLISALGTTGTFYIWNPNPLGKYDFGKYEAFTYLSGDYVSTDGGIINPAIINNYILSGQAFFVQTGTSSYNLDFEESAKAETNTNIEYYRGNKEQEPVSVLSSRIFTSSGVPTDGTIQIFGREFTDEVDIADARKLSNSGVNLSVKVGTALLAVERRTSISEKDTIFYNLSGLTPGLYSFNFDAQNLYTPGFEAWLEDGFTQTKTQVNLEGTTQIPFEVTSNSNSRATDRFFISFSTRGALPVTFTKIEAVRKGNAVNVTWNVAQENNVSKYVVMHSTDGRNFKDLTEVDASGISEYSAMDVHPADGYNYYRIKNVDLSGSSSYSQIAKVHYGDLTPALSVNPNPVTKEFVSLKMENLPVGKYNTRILNTIGQTISTHSFNYQGGIVTEKIRWNPGDIRGNYNLEVKYPDGSLKTIVIVY
ncbi:MAG: hypothetical protein J5I50_10060 [Chitinophagaceae bacterium]|nr:hypothetical protein [Chitinophagaceae bacterium]